MLPSIERQRGFVMYGLLIVFASTLMLLFPQFDKVRADGP
jgi:hypothetical protein